MAEFASTRIPLAVYDDRCCNEPFADPLFVNRLLSYLHGLIFEASMRTAGKINQGVRCGACVARVEERARVVRVGQMRSDVPPRTRETRAGHPLAHRTRTPPLLPSPRALDTSTLLFLRGPDTGFR